MESHVRTHLYRVVDANAWVEAQKTGRVPRCASDARADHVHLNVKESVETVATHFFEAAEKPLVLEIDPAGFAAAIVWLDPTEQKPWPQPCARIPNIPLEAVVATHRLEFQPGSAGFRLAEG